MDRSKWFFYSLVCIYLVSCAEVKQSALEEPQPNLIVIMTDDQGWADVGFNGCQDIPTPHIDRIAQEGVRFAEAYVTFPVCGPSRAGFLTGRYQDRFGFTTNPSIDPGNPTAGLPLEEETIAQVLQKADYRSAIIGKWHMGTHPLFHPLERGFDYFFGFLSGGHNYYPQDLYLDDITQVTKKWEWYRTKLIENRQPIKTQDYLTDELSDAAVRFIKKQSDAGQHFMLYLAYNAPHTPLQATEKYLARFPDIQDEKRKTYAAMVSAVDDGVGRVLQALAEQGIDEHTLIVFLSDNGGARNNASQNTPLRGFKSDLFEGGIRVPFAMRWKGVIPAGQQFNKPISSLDIMATIVAQNEIPIAPERPLDGVDLIPFLTGKKDGEPHDYLFWRKWEQDAMAVRKGHLKLVSNWNQKGESPYLFDVVSDISENKQLTGDNQQDLDDLMSNWNDWNAQLKDRVFPTLGADVWWTEAQR